MNNSLIADLLLESTPKSRASASAYWADRKARDQRKKELRQDFEKRVATDPAYRAEIEAQTKSFNAAQEERRKNSPVDTSGDW